MPPCRNLHWLSLIILAIGLLSVCPLGIFAQSSAVTLAQSVGDNPKSNATHAQSTGSLVTTSASTAVSHTPSPSLSGGKSNTGVIVGGVVGGVVGIALIAAVVVLFALKQKRSQILPSAQSAGAQISPPSAGYVGSTSFLPRMSQPRLYDPSDPSTFPASVHPATGPSHGVQNGPSSHYTSSLRPGGRHGGMPEI